MYTICACESVPCVSGLRVQSAKKEQKESKIFLNFFVFLLPFFCFFVSFVSPHKKKKKFSYSTKKRRRNLDLFHLLCAPLNTHAHKRPSSSWYVLRRRREKRRRCDCCSLYSFRFCCVHLSLSLSLLSRVIEDFLTNRGRESTDFFFDSFFPVNF